MSASSRVHEGAPLVRRRVAAARGSRPESLMLASGALELRGSRGQEVLLGAGRSCASWCKACRQDRHRRDQHEQEGRPLPANPRKPADPGRPPARPARRGIDRHPLRPARRGRLREGSLTSVAGVRGRAACARPRPPGCMQCDQRVVQLLVCPHLVEITDDLRGGDRQQDHEAPLQGPGVGSKCVRTPPPRTAALCRRVASAPARAFASFATCAFARSRSRGPTS